MRKRKKKLKPKEKAPCNDDIISFDGNGFYEFTEKLISNHRDSTIEIEVHLTTTLLDGLLIWKRSERYKDYLSLGLQDGQVRLDYHYSKLGKTVTVVSTEGIADGKNHTIRVTKMKGGDSTLQIDGNAEERGRAGLGREDKDQLNTSKGPLYLGGLPLGTNVEETTLGLYANGFSGCITYINFVYTVGIVTFEIDSQQENFYKTREQGGTVVEDYGGDVSCGSSCARDQILTTEGFNWFGG